MIQQWEQVTWAIVEQVSDLLATQVLVLNRQGVAIASSEPDLVGLSLSQQRLQEETVYLRIPIHLKEEWGQVVVAQPMNGEVISSRLVQGLVTWIINQTTLVAQLPHQHELKNKFIHDLLQGSNVSEIEILREGQILGMDLTRPRAVILIDAADYILTSFGLRELELAAPQVWQRAQQVINSIVSFFHLPNDTICAYIGDGEIAVLKASSTQDLVAWTSQQDEPHNLNSSWADLAALKRAAIALLTRLRYDTQSTLSIGIGRYHPKIYGLAHSYQDARAALSLGRHVRGQNQIHCLDELGIAAFVGISDEKTKIELARHLLSPLDQEPELLETLDVFFLENCCSSSTASQLSIHRNTLSYRLEKITSLVGLDPRQFDDAIQIRLACLLRVFQADVAGLCTRPTLRQQKLRNFRQMSDVSSA